ncbi:SDR family oxidoreductase [Saccharopolyspora griseoalba]|uniref:SDR family oxidoreductase n=1 Tax=Saccharopolyspora griseoalba TaxID=1431848 RepID=A0ABW2LM69_9PSEU
MLLPDAVVVISGVGAGLGRSLALRSAAAGAHVVLAARTEQRLTEVAAEVAELGREALVLPTDIGDETACRELVSRALETFGRVDGLVNNAFALPPLADLAETDLDALRAALDTTVLGTLRLTRLLTPALVDSGGAAVMVNSAVLRHSRRPYGPYKMTKSALLSMTRSLSAELGPRGVRVNTVAPGYIWADSLKWYLGHLAEQRGVTRDQVYAETAGTTDLRKLPEPDEIADAAVFLLSPMARAITGQCLDVNAGEFHH